MLLEHHKTLLKRKKKHCFIGVVHSFGSFKVQNFVDNDSEDVGDDNYVQYLNKNLSTFLNDVWLMLQMVFGGLTDVNLHALARERERERERVKLAV